MPKITRARLDALPEGATIRDSELKGFFATRGPRGVALRAQADLRVPGQPKKTLKTTLGTWPRDDLDAARAEAMRWLAAIRDRKDPRPDKAPLVAGELTVGRMFELAAKTLETRKRAPRTVDDLRRLGGYLEAWQGRPATGIKPSELEAEHARLSRAHGPIVANKVVRAFRGAFNIAAARADDPLGPNPVRAAFGYNAAPPRTAVLRPDQLGAWWTKLQTCEPARRLLHEFGLHSALRPGTLVKLERSWLDLDGAAGPRLCVPAAAQKGRRDFVLPLSPRLVELSRAALALADMTARGRPWLWPSKSMAGEWQATASWRERKLKGQTGHILRATWRTVAASVGVEGTFASLLMDHKIGGLEGVYIRSAGLWAELCAAQNTVSARLAELCGVDNSPMKHC